MNGSQQICFTDSAGKTLFPIPDNGLLCLFYGNGDRHFAVCHRLDDTHAEIDGVNYSLPDFAKRMKHNQISSPRHKAGKQITGGFENEKN